MKKAYRLDHLCCANCAAKIEDKIGKLPGVTRATVNFLTGRLTIEAGEAEMEHILTEAEKIVHKVEPDSVMVAL
ncbi:MAG: heavy metal-associated domain-containing protein [Clostridiaceae bacterium]|nr:heavy metal-associated domain-containing protein [Clostridiaceae bacterium]